MPRSSAPAGGALTGQQYGYRWYGFSRHYGAFGSGLSAYSFWPPFGYGYPVTAPSYFDEYAASDPFGAAPIGGLRLKVEPRQAQVFVDGYYAGIVDDFDGLFQHLNITPGPHHIEVRASGYESLEFDITIQPHHTIEYRGALIASPPSQK